MLKSVLLHRQLNEELSELERQNKVLWIAKEFNAEQMRTVMLVITATNDEVLNHRIFHLAESQHKLVNVVDDQPHCSFIFPSIIDRNPIQIAISSGGKAPVLARLLREKLEALLPQHLGKIAEISGKWRDQVKAKLASVTERRRFWEKMFSGRFASLVKNQQEAQAEEELAEQLENNYQGGFVSLVGAGPGDAGLLTLNGLQEIQQADVVLYDALVSGEILSLIRRDAERIFVGETCQWSFCRTRRNQPIVINPCPTRQASSAFKRRRSFRFWTRWRRIRSISSTSNSIFGCTRYYSGYWRNSLCWHPINSPRLCTKRHFCDRSS